MLHVQPNLWEHPLFEGIDLSSVRPLLHARPRRIRTGHVLSSPKQRPASFHLLLAGQLQSYELSVDGRRLILEIVEPGGMDGLLQVASHQGHFTEAVKDSLVVSISEPELRRLTDAEPWIAVNLLRMVLGRLQRREQQLDSVVHKDPTVRIARQLLALSEYLGDPKENGIALRPRVTHQMLADMLGVRRETVTLHLQLLTRVKAVRVVGDRLVLDQKLLRRVVERDPRLPIKSASGRSQASGHAGG
jgi:CRP/FNR family transcriptional regulator, cyclic AMP receptor protein